MNLPQNVEISFEDYCKDCPICLLSVSKTEVENFDCEVETHYEILCAHAQSCQRVVTFYKGEK